MRSYLSLLQWENVKLLQSFLTGQESRFLLWPFRYLCGPSLYPLQSVHTFLELWGPELDMVLYMWLQERWVEWDDHIPVSASNAPVGAAQDPIYLGCCTTALLTRIQIVVHQDSQVPLSQAAPQLHRSWPVLLYCPRCRALHLSFRLNTVPAALLFQPVSLWDGSTFWQVISNLGEGAFNLIIQIIYEHIEQHGAWYWFLGDNLWQAASLSK